MSEGRRSNGNRRELVVGGLAFAILAVLVVTNLRQWSNNLEHAPRKLRPQFWGNASTQAVFGRQRYGCAFYFEDEMPGSTLVLPSRFSSLNWPLREVSRVEVERAEMVELSPEQSVAALALPHEITGCLGKDIRVVQVAARARYQLALTSNGRFILLPEAILERLRGQTPLTVSCDLARPAAWQAENRSASVGQGQPLAIDVDAANKPAYVMTGGAHGLRKGPESRPCPKQLVGPFLVQAESTVSEGALTVRLYVVQYSAKGRLTHESMVPGQQPLLIEPKEEAVDVRYALRLKGRGKARLSSLQVLSPNPQLMSGIELEPVD
ncbi:MAG: hypothetical protein KJO07_15120 [Deltaproteobacteria bacterium]|nr:hypothetical protein [Deltaproteobacteria bacterium]